MHQRAHELSGGQKQRLAFAQAVIQDRPILLLDEPFQGLDDHHRTLCHQVLRQRHVQDEPRFTLLASHHQEDVEALADHIVQGDHGCFRQILPPNQMAGGL